MALQRFKMTRMDIMVQKRESDNAVRAGGTD